LGAVLEIYGHERGGAKKQNGGGGQSLRGTAGEINTSSIAKGLGKKGGHRDIGTRRGGKQREKKEKNLDQMVRKRGGQK